MSFGFMKIWKQLHMNKAGQVVKALLLPEKWSAAGRFKFLK